MKLTLFSTLTLAVPLLAQDLSSRVREETLDQLHPVRVNVAPNGVTTLQFPDRIKAAEGAAFTTDPNKQPGQFYLAQGDNWLTLRALDNCEDQNLNVVIKGKVYPVLVHAVALNDYAVVFHYGQGTDSSAPVTPAPEPKAVTAPRVAGVIEKLKIYPVLSAQHPDAYVDMTYSEPKAPESVTAKVSTRVERVLRDNNTNLVALEVKIKNKTDQPFNYDPNAVQARAGKVIFPTVMSDGTGTVPPNGEGTAYVALTNVSPSGNPEALAADNPFTAIVKER
jgi:hypothetical protein